MRAAAEAAVATGNDVLYADALSEALDALRDELRVLDDIGRMGHHAGDEDLPVRQPNLVPDGVFVLMARVRTLDEVGLRLHLEHEVDHVLELDVVGVRPVPASPAQVIAHA